MQTVNFEIITLHASGGPDMLSQTAESRDKCFSEGSKCANKPVLLGVTILTSLKNEQLDLIGSRFSVTDDAVSALAELSKNSGLDGIVSSVHEVRSVKEKFGQDFKVLTPGIRPTGFSSDDQVRVATPAMAKEMGSDYIVVGRPITQSDNPVGVVEQILHELQ